MATINELHIMKGTPKDVLNELRNPLIQQYKGVIGLDINYRDSHGIIYELEGAFLFGGKNIKKEKPKDDWKNYYKQQFKYACMLFYTIFIKTPIDLIKSYFKKGD